MTKQTKTMHHGISMEGDHNDMTTTTTSPSPSSSSSSSSSSKKTMNCHFDKLPNELISTIFAYLDPKELFYLSRSCRRFHTCLDPKTPQGKQTWSHGRRSIGFPDPTLLGLTDYQFFAIYYSRGCDFCPDHPNVRKIKWCFKGRRFCDDCYNRLTQKDWELRQSGIDESRYKYLPFDQNNSSHTFYLVKDILDHNPSDQEIQQLKRRREIIHLFESRLRTAEWQIERRKRDAVERMQNKRKRQIIGFVLQNVPILDESLLSMLPAFQNACKKTEPFTNKASKTRLLTSIRKQMQEHGHKLAKERLNSVMEKHLGVDEWKTITLALNFSDQVARLSKVTTFKETLEFGLGIVALNARQEEWRSKYASDLNRVKYSDLLKCKAFELGDENRIAEFIEFTKELRTEQERIEAKEKLQRDWVRTYARELEWTPYYHEFIKNSEIYQNACEEREEEFKAFVAPLNLKYEREENRRRWLLIVPSAMRERLRASEAFQSGDSSREDEVRKLINELRDEYEQRLEDRREKLRTRLKDHLCPSIYEKCETKALLSCEGSHCFRNGATVDIMIEHLLFSGCKLSKVDVVPELLMDSC